MLKGVSPMISPELLKIIAEMLSLIHIFVIGEHGILERGTHAQLVAQGGVYAELAAGARLSGETE